VRLASAYVDALVDGDEVEAEIAIREAMDAGMSSAEIDDRVIAPALWHVGELWELGEINVAQEHLATEISLRVLTLQHEARRVAQARSGHRVMLTTAPGEQHVVALRMAENLLRGAGYEILMLGADVPSDGLAAATRSHKPDVVCISSTMIGRTSLVLAAIDEARRGRPAVAIVLGGRGLTVESEARPDVRLCERVSDVVDTVDAMIQRADLN